GNQGNDQAFMGAGADIFQSSPGGRSDTVQGECGYDVMLSFGANVSENIDISANGPRVRFSRNIGNITMDLNGVEDIEFRALAGRSEDRREGKDGRALTEAYLKNEAAEDGGDGQAYTVNVRGTD